jgi:hypothetical protein
LQMAAVLGTPVLKRSVLAMPNCVISASTFSGLRVRGMTRQNDRQWLDDTNLQMAAVLDQHFAIAADADDYAACTVPLTPQIPPQAGSCPSFTPMRR